MAKTRSQKRLRNGIFYKTKRWYRELVAATTHCTYCNIRLKKDNRSDDHIVPLSKGGKKNARDNIQIICFKCNQKKAASFHSKFRTEIGVKKITIDFETRSACDLKLAGAHKYAMHPTTQVMCLSYKLGKDKTKLWHRGYPELPQSLKPYDLLEALEHTPVIEAHNSQFECAIWRYTLRREFPWFPEIQDSQWRCSAAKAAAFALPRSLANLGPALRLKQLKDESAKRIMLKLSKPKTLTKSEKEEADFLGLDPDEILKWHEDPSDLKILHDYCIQDTDTEDAASSNLRDLIPREQRLWQVDLAMNARGITCDIEMAEAAIKITSDATIQLNNELSEITKGNVPRASMRDRFKKWITKHGVKIPNTQAATIDKFLEQDNLRPYLKRALEICKLVNRSSTAKYKRMIKQVSDDGRIRDTQLYHGASTGRWSGKGVQPHNFVRGYSDDMEEVCSDIIKGDVEYLEMMWGEPIDVLAKAARGALVASPGHELIVADYSAIEARAVLWLAMDEAGLDVFRRGEDPYIDMASSIYKVKYEDIGEKSPERQIGKQAVLGLGFGMGGEKFDDTCYGYGIIAERKFFNRVVKIYREEKFPLVASYWKDTENAAIEAVKTGKTITCRRTKWGVRGRFLHVRLPSGRLLSYCEPLIKIRRSWHFAAVNKQGKESQIMVSTSNNASLREAQTRALKVAKNQEKKLIRTQFNDPKAFNNESLTFMSQVNNKWVRDETYGGKLVENVTQATARDMMAEAMVRVEDHSIYQLLMAVHDEVVSERPLGKGSLSHYEKLMSQSPSWAGDCPIQAKGWVGQRYKKV